MRPSSILSPSPGHLALISATITATALSGCSKQNPAQPLPPEQAATPTQQIPANQPQAPTARPLPNYSTQSPVGKEVLASMDLRTDPCQDFYRFACGAWLDRTQLPADKPRYGRGFGVVRDRNSEGLRSILEQAATAKGEAGKIGRYYAACMDEASIDQMALKPLKPYLKEIDRVKKVRDIVKLIGKRHNFSLAGTFLRIGVDNDFKDPDLYIVYVGQGGLGLGDRSYYLEAQKKPVLDAYRAHIARMLAYTGKSPEQAATSADKIIAFETRLAQVSKPKHELRDPEKLYHPTTEKDLNKTVKGLYVRDYFRAAKMRRIKTINVSTPEYIAALPGILEQSDIEDLRDYMRFHLIKNTADRLSKEVVDTNFMFTAQLTGTKKLRPRWQRCVQATTGAYPDLVAQAYIERYFPGDSKQTALSMIKNVEKAFEAGLPKLAWMDDNTRKRAIEKMNAIGNKVGFPDKWRSYKGVDSKKGYFDNTVAIRDFGHQKKVKKIGKRVDEKEWFIPASMVNAFYNPQQNEMVFPAGILQPPYFSQDFNHAMNYGAMGMVMGHELTHGFDDSGRKFDGQGVMQEWWDPSVSQRFETQAACVEKAYSAVEVQPGIHINGKLTLGENIADFGGIKYAYHGYKLWSQQNGAEPPLIDGMSNEQLFFVAFAQGWCTKSSPEFDRRAIVMDPHSPPKERVNLPLAHFDGFWETFQCGEGTPMRPKNTCAVW